jgi:hypothetical protein
MMMAMKPPCLLSMGRAIVVAVTMSLALAAPAYAQTQAQAAKLSDFLDKTGRELTTSGMNLLQMSMEMRSPEMDVLSMIHSSSSEAAWYADKLSQVTFIYSVMLDKRDQATVKKMMVMQVKQSVRGSNTSIEQVNKMLGKLQSPAAVAEAQKCRDLIQMIRDEIQRTIPGS